MVDIVNEMKNLFPPGIESPEQRKMREDQAFFAMLEIAGFEKIKAVMDFERKYQEAYDESVSEEQREAALEGAKKLVQSHPQVFDYPSDNDITDRNQAIAILEAAIFSTQESIDQVDKEMFNTIVEYSDASKTTANDVVDFQKAKVVEALSVSTRKNYDDLKASNPVMNFLNIGKDVYENNSAIISDIISRNIAAFKERLNITGEKYLSAIEYIGLMKDIRKELAEANIDPKFKKELSVKDMAKFANQNCKTSIDNVHDNLNSFFAKYQPLEKTKTELVDTKERLESELKDLKAESVFKPPAPPR